MGNVIYARTLYSSRNGQNLVIKELDAAQTPRALDSITAAVINDDFATTAKLTVEESIYTEPVNKDSEQWINIIVANKKDENNKIYTLDLKQLGKGETTYILKDGDIVKILEYEFEFID